MYDKLNSMLNSSRQVKAIGQSLPEYELALFAFNNFKFNKYSRLKNSYEQYLKNGKTHEYENHFIASAVSKLPTDQQLNFFQDPDYKDKDHIRGAVYDQFGSWEENGEMIDRELDITFLPYLIEDIKKVMKEMKNG